MLDEFVGKSKKKAKMQGKEEHQEKSAKNGKITTAAEISSTASGNEIDGSEANQRKRRSLSGNSTISSQQPSSSSWFLSEEDLVHYSLSSPSSDDNNDHRHHLAAAITTLYNRLESERKRREQRDKEKQRSLLRAISTTLTDQLPLTIQQAIQTHLSRTNGEEKLAAEVRVLREEVKALSHSVRARSKIQVEVDRVSRNVASACRPVLSETFARAFEHSLVPAMEQGTVALTHQVQY